MQCDLGGQGAGAGSGASLLLLLLYCVWCLSNVVSNVTLGDKALELAQVRRYCGGGCMALRILKRLQQCDFGGYTALELA
jgi:hypothetical protein